LANFNSLLEDARRALIVYATASDALNTTHTPQVNPAPKRRASPATPRAKKKSKGAGLLGGVAGFLAYISKIKD